MLRVRTRRAVAPVRSGDVSESIESNRIFESKNELRRRVAHHPPPLPQLHATVCKSSSIGVGGGGVGEYDVSYHKSICTVPLVEAPF